MIFAVSSCAVKMNRHSLFIPFILCLLLVGSAGWLYSAHFCKTETSCHADAGACCNDMAESADVCGEQMNATAGMQGCCSTVNAFMYFPVYPILKMELPAEQFFSLLSTPFEDFTRLVGDEVSFQPQFTLSSHPPDDHQALLRVRRI